MPIKTKTNMPGLLPRSFEQLVTHMPPMAIRDDLHHERTLEIIDRLMQIDAMSPGQCAYLETLVELVEAYEAHHHAIDESTISGFRMVKHIVENSGMSGSDLARLLGMHPTMGSKILNGDRKLTWEHAKALGAHFNLTPAMFMD